MSWHTIAPVAVLLMVLTLGLLLVELFAPRLVRWSLSLLARVPWRWGAFAALLIGPLLLPHGAVIALGMILVMLLVGLLAPKLIPMPGFLSEGAPRKRRFALALLVTGLLLLPAVVGMLKGPQPIPIQAHAVGF